jgi:cytochrome P450
LNALNFAAMAAPTPLSELSPFDPAVLADPWDFYRRVREEAPVYRDPNTGLFLISSYAAVSEAVQNWEVFSNRFGIALGGANAQQAPDEVRDVQTEGYPPVDTMLTADPPEQRRFRKLVNKAFTVRKVEKLSDRVTNIANELIDGFIDDGEVELLSRYAQPLPMTVIAEQLGAPREDLAQFRRWTDGFLAQLSGVASADAQVEAAKLILEFQHYFAERLEERRKEPRDDILSDIVHAQVEGERDLDVAEMLSILQQLLVAGNETTASAITEGVWLLMQNPDQLALLEKAPERIPNAVEEILRVSTPTANMWRFCKQDTELHGVAIPAGSMCMLRFAAANRDPAVFPEPDRFDITRANADQHLAFGLGVHFCLGAQLARKEMATAYRVLLERLTDFRPTPGATPGAHRPNVLLWGFDRLNLSFSPRS